MLVLSRQKDQTIMIGDLIEITVVEVRGDKVRLGIAAPVSIPVHRKEVYEAIQRENQEAARATVDDVSTLERSIRRQSDAPARQQTDERPGSQHRRILDTAATITAAARMADIPTTAAQSRSDSK